VLPDRDNLLVEEIVAGVIEPGEVGLEALRRRGAEELREEAGLDVALEALEPLGGPFFMLPGISSEKIHLLACEVDVGTARVSAEAAGGDGSPLEEGAELGWRPLAEAVEACERGEIEDAKSELAFRRLAARLGERLRAGR
jgi:ADP-ribose pyrophosphatase